eukprot:scaffold9084_cov22-Tisochrysis_lutea.AAC.5
MPLANLHVPTVCATMRASCYVQVLHRKHRGHRRVPAVCHGLTERGALCPPCLLPCHLPAWVRICVPLCAWRRWWWGYTEGLVLMSS